MSARERHRQLDHVYRDGLSWVTKGFERGGAELDSGRNARGSRKPLCVFRTIIICEIVAKLRDIEWLLMTDIPSRAQ